LRERANALYCWDRVGEQMVAVYHALIEGEPLPHVMVGRSASVHQG
jgi:hypothetical protein